MHSDKNNRKPDGNLTLHRAPKRADCDFHLIKPEYADNSISRALNSGLISEDDNDLIQRFVIESKIERGFGIGHANKITFDLVRWRNYCGEYRKNTYTDVLKAIDKIQVSPMRHRPACG